MKLAARALGVLTFLPEDSVPRRTPGTEPACGGGWSRHWEEQSLACELLSWLTICFVLVRFHSPDDFELE